MNVGSCVSSFCCIDVIDDELSIMNKMSISLLIFCVKFVVNVAVGVMSGFSSVREVQAQRAGTAAAEPTQRMTGQHFDERRARPIMESSSSRTGAGAPHHQRRG